MNVLYFNLSIDKNDAPLAFGIDWVDNFSQTAERVDVLTFRQGEYELPSNVTVYSISRSSRFKAISRLLTVIRFYRVLWKLLRSFKYDLCFSHMNIINEGLKLGAITENKNILRKLRHQILLKVFFIMNLFYVII